MHHPRDTRSHLIRLAVFGVAHPSISYSEPLERLLARRGYLIMHCSCGRHMENLHKTPSRRDHFKNKVARMIAQCDSRVG